jgi:GT2 family glycosyltransferase
MISDTVAPEISVVVVNYNGRHWLESCLSALEDHGASATEIILVDNQSTDGSPEWVRERFRHVRVHEAGSNLGFAGGNNAGARLARGEFLAFLNNDTIAEPGWLGALRRALSADPAAGLATSKIVYIHDPSIVDSAGDGYLRAGGAFKHFHGESAAVAGDPREVFGACGAAFMIRRDLFLQLGGFDEDFFMVYEDVDLSFRARLRGYRCVYVADAVVRHAGSASLGPLSPSAVFLGQRNLEWTYLKNMPLPLLLRSLPSHVLYDTAAAFRFASAGLLGAFLRAKWAAVAGLPRVLKKRAGEQRRRRSSAAVLWRAMESGWIRQKYREKQFDFRRGATRTSS